MRTVRAELVYRPEGPRVRMICLGCERVMELCRCWQSAPAYRERMRIACTLAWRRLKATP